MADLELSIGAAPGWWETLSEDRQDRVLAAYRRRMSLEAPSMGAITAQEMRHCLFEMTVWIAQLWDGKQVAAPSGWFFERRALPTAAQIERIAGQLTGDLKLRPDVPEDHPDYIPLDDPRVGVEYLP